VAKCIGKVDSQTNDSIVLKRPIPNSWVQACIDGANVPPGIKFRSNLARTPDPIVPGEGNDRGFLRVPCDSLPPDLKSNVRNKALCADKRALGWFDGFRSGYRGGMIYVPDRGQVFAATESIKSIRDADGDAVFWLDATYEAALDKIRFNNDLFVWLGWVIVSLAALTALYVVFLMLQMIVGHRKINYVVLLCDGFSGWQIRALLLMQVGLSCLSGATLVGVLEESLRWLGNRIYPHLPIGEEGLDVLGTADVQVLPSVGLALAVLIVVAVYLGSLLILLCVSTYRLRLRSSPMDLVS
jgi:hypothetical protein